MKIYHYILVATLILFNYSCKKDTVGVSKVTNYITFDLTGGPIVTFAKGNAYVDPGYKAMEGETDVSTKVTTSGEVNGNQVGMYTVTYTAVNAEGFPSSTDRTVIIYDPAAPATDLTGTYKSSVQRVSPSRSFSGLSVTITKLAPGFFSVSDFLGGFYDQGYKYGSGYAAAGYFQLNADNTITLVDSYVPGWGDKIHSLTNGVYDPSTSLVSWDAVYVNDWVWKVTLSK